MGQWVMKGVKSREDRGLGRRGGKAETALSVSSCPPTQETDLLLICPYLARVLVSVRLGTDHFVGDRTWVEGLTLLPAEESYPGNYLALIVPG